MKYTPDFSSRFRILKGGKISLVVSALIAGSTMCFASPTGGQVTTGSASITQSGSLTTINQSTDKASINWNSFSIAPNETVNFVQPSAQSVTLNRVVGTTSSLIQGAMNANGQVFLINPNGVLFTKDAQVNVGGLVASTLNLTDENFQNGNYVFEGNSQNSIINMGTISTAQGGYVAMMGKTVANEGTIVATMGNVQLAGGEKISLNLNGDSLVKLTIDQGTLNTLVENKGLIKADGGQVYLTTQALNTILDGMVNNTGIIEAQSLSNVDGKIVLYAHGGTLQAGGTITTGEGTGSVETSGKVFTSDASLHVSTGSWLIDPVDITIDSTLASTIQTALGSGTVAITTNGSNTPSTSSGETTASGNGDITVAAPMSWSANNLILSAGGNINIDAQLDLTSTAGLFLAYGQAAVASGNTAKYNVNAPINIASTGTFSTKLGSDGSAIYYTIIDSLGNAGSTTGTDLQGINGNLSGNYVLGSNIDASSTSSWNSGAGWTPIGNGSANFLGIFDGLGHIVSGLYINNSPGAYQGLFGYTEAFSIIKNLGLTNVSITGGSQVGSLVGDNYSTITNSYATGSVSASSDIVGGLVGSNFGSISNAYSAASVNGSTTNVGGFVGSNAWDGSITNSYATGNVYGESSYIGGFVGYSTGLISQAYATGNITSGSSSMYVGGFAGANNDNMNNSAEINNAYATGNVSGNSYIGGFVGQNMAQMGNSATITDSYSIGSISGGSGGNVGGLVGDNTSGTVTGSFWNMTTSGMTTDGASSGTTGLTTTQFTDASHFSAWANTIWSSGDPSTAGYGIASRPYLTNVTTNADKPAMTTLFAGGYGTSASPYTITTATQLQNLGNANVVEQTYYYDLSNDIDLTGVTWTPIGNYVTGFAGIFDGQNHVVSNLTLSGGNYIGLFGASIAGSIIKNIGVTNVSISGAGDVGGLIGRSFSTISNAYSTGTITATGDVVGGLVGYSDGSGAISGSYSSVNVTATGNYIGGLVGFNDSAISGSYANGSITGDATTSDYVGGLVGYTEKDISNSYATGSVSGHAYIGGFDGENYANTTISDSYSTGSVTGSVFNYYGGFSGYNGGTITNSFWDTTTSGQSTSAGGTGLTTAQFADSSNFSTWSTSVWSFGDPSTAGYGIASRPYLTNVTTNADKPAMTTLFAGGYGTSASPYTITTATQLQNMDNANVLGQMYYYDLSNDIDLTGVTWTPIGDNLSSNFYGIFDGQNHIIDNLTIDSSLGDQGLFGIIAYGSVVKNIGLTDVSITGGSEKVGALAGENYGTVSNSYSYANARVSGNSYVGGLVGLNGGTITDSYATGNVSGNAYIGGFVGEMTNSSAQISSSCSTSTVSSTGVDIGGFIGGLDGGSISNSYSTGDVSGGSYVGGFAGYSYQATPISNSYAAGYVSANDTSVGGFTGWEDSSGGITNSFWNTTTSGMTTDAAGSGTTGLTTAQMQNMSSFGTWDIVSVSSSTGTTYPQLRWITGDQSVGTSVWVMSTGSSGGSGGSSGGTSSSSSGTTATNTINNVVTTIVNQTSLTTPVPTVIAPLASKPQQEQTQAQNNLLLQTILPQNSTIEGTFGLVETTGGLTPVQTVNMEDLQKVSRTQGISEIRVPLGQDSMVELINGGVNLPKGLGQEFYVVNNNNVNNPKKN